MSYARGAAQRGIADLRNRTVLENLGKTLEPSLGPTWKKHESPTSEKLFEAKDMSKADKIDYFIEDLDGRVSMNLGQEEVLNHIKFLSFMTVAQILERRGGMSSGRAVTPFLVTEEVLTLKNMKEDAWLGKDGEPGARDLLSAWGDSRININTALPGALAAVPDLSAGTVQNLYRYRCGKDGKPNTQDDRFFSTFGEMVKVCRLSDSEVTLLQRYCKLTSRFFTITGLATRMQGKVKAVCTATVEVRGENLKVLQWREGPIDF
jgi:hypothetical protein